MNSHQRFETGLLVQATTTSSFLGLILVTLTLLAVFSAAAKSYSIWSPSHTSGRLSKALESRIAISGEIPDFRFNRLLRFCRVTLRRAAVSVTVRLRGSMHSCRMIRHGWGVSSYASFISPWWSSINSTSHACPSTTRKITRQFARTEGSIEPFPVPFQGMEPEKPGDPYRSVRSHG